MDSCAVCEGPGSGIFFGVFTCRPCASFFRRSVRERRQYVCRQQGDCPIDKEGMRNCCRACRLRRCLLTGMRAEMASAEGGSSSDNKSAATTPEVEDPAAAGSRQKMPVPSSAAFAAANGAGGDIVSLNFPLATPLIHRLVQSVREYDNALRAIVVQHFGLGIIVNTRPRLICQSECNLLKRTSAPLQVALVRAQLTDFDALQSHQKASFMQEFSMHFSTLSSADMTVKAFPGQKLHQMVILPGCMMDRDRYEEFCDVTRGHGKDQQVQWDRFGLPLLDRYLNFIQTRYVPLAVSTAEFAALMGLIICNCALNCLGPAACSEQRDQLFAELHSLAIQRAQSSSDGDVRSIPVRFGQLLSLLTEMATLSKELSEFFDLIRVFVDPESGSSFPNFSEAWTDIFSQQQRNGRVGREEGPV